MASNLTFGAVPPFYREVYDIVCPNQEHVDQDIFIKILIKSSLPKVTLSQIWEVADSKQGFLTRNGLYKALALIALAQQGKAINEKLLESYSDQELPRPSLGDLSDLQSHSARVRREAAPNVLGYSFSDLCDMDRIKVELVPEKKGLIIKHVEYEVTSQRYNSTVLRRYTDFITLQELLLVRFPYRIIPELPPKKVMTDREFIEHRRKALRRFLTLIARHPVLTQDAIVKYFLTFSGSDMQNKMKENFRGVPDEFMSNEMALQAKDLVPMDTQIQFANSKEHIRILTDSTRRIRDIAERTALRSASYASDVLQLGKELGSLGSDTTSVSAWACGHCDTWSKLKKGFKGIGVEYAGLGDKASVQAIKLEDSVVEVLNTFLDLLTAYKDLCDRHEKGVLREHQRAIQKMGLYKKKKMTATVQGHEVGTVEQLEQRILQQENEISNMENRNFFSLHCIQMETQLVHTSLEGFYYALQSMASEEASAYSQLSSVWLMIKPRVDAILPNPSTNQTASATPKVSPLASPDITNTKRL